MQLKLKPQGLLHTMFYIQERHRACQQRGATATDRLQLLDQSAKLLL